MLTAARGPLVVSVQDGAPSGGLARPGLARGHEWLPTSRSQARVGSRSTARARVLSVLLGRLAGRPGHGEAVHPGRAHTGTGAPLRRGFSYAAGRVAGYSATLKVKTKLWMNQIRPRISPRCRIKNKASMPVERFEGVSPSLDWRCRRR